MPTANELQRGAELRKALLDAEQRYQADFAAARLQFRDGIDPRDFPAFDAAVKEADRQRAERTERAYEQERAAAATEFAPAPDPQIAAAATRQVTRAKRG
jgi:hypothetical protein